jgi:hypothetical protein
MTELAEYLEAYQKAIADYRKAEASCTPNDRSYFLQKELDAVRDAENRYLDHLIERIDLRRVEPKRRSSDDYY